MPGKARSVPPRTGGRFGQGPGARSSGLLLLEDGSVFEGVAVAPGTRFGEVVFNTSMTGYQEILTDPSYRGQIVVMTLPHIGNYGISADVAESERSWVEGFIARQFTAVPSSHGSEGTIGDFLRAQGVPAIDGIDTRAVVRLVRQHGAMRGVLTTERTDLAALQSELADFPSMSGRALVEEVTCRQAWEMAPPAGVATRFRLAVYDFGVKSNILRHLAARGAHLTVLPASTPAADCLALEVDGVVLSNGPGDPEPLVGVVAAVRELIAAGIPIFGICLGHQLLGLALGGRTFKLKFGHHGGNQPVRVCASGRVLITSQNHGFAVDAESLPANCRVTEVNLNDGTVEAFAVSDRPVFSAQYHPEAAPGPRDATSLFDRFLEQVAAAPQ
jgi:carbamoyl-phosphate synthase small subunit